MLDEALKWFLAALAGSDTTLLVTADHGFIDSPSDHRIELDDHPELAAMLTRPLCGERRVAYCYVRAEHRARFESYIHERFHGKADLYPSTQILAAGW